MMQINMSSYNNNSPGGGGVSIDDESSFDAFQQKERNVVSPDEGSSSCSGFGFNFCCVMDSLCGEQTDASTTFDDEGEIVTEKTKSAYMYDDTIYHCCQLQQQPAVDSMNVDSYTSVTLPKPIGIRFEENDFNYGGVFVADIDHNFSAAADGSIRLGYQLIAVGERRVSGMNFDEAVMQPIVDNTEAEVTLIFFKGSAACLYHPSSANEEWLDNFVAMNARKQTMKNVEIQHDDAVIEIVASTIVDDESEDDVPNGLLPEELNEAAQDEIIEDKPALHLEEVPSSEEAQPTEHDTLDLQRSSSFNELDFHDETNDDFFSNVPDLSTKSFDWARKKNIEPREDMFEPEEETTDATLPWLQLPQNDSPAFSETATDDQVSSENIDAGISESVSVGESNDREVISETESALDGDENYECDAISVSEDQSIADKAACKLPQVEASYCPSLGFELKKDEVLPEVSEDEVLIRVEASTISTRDCLERIRRHKNRFLKIKSWVPGHEIVGHVVRAGKKAKVLLGRKVAALLSHGGGCSRYVCIHAKNLISVPETADSIEMVALLSTYMAAYQCLEVHRQNCVDSVTSVSGNITKPDDTTSTEVAVHKNSPLSGSSILITGAGHPVGLALIDIAKNAGATVYALSHSSHEKSVKELGVKGWFPLFRKQEWKAQWTGKMNLIIDTDGNYDNYPLFYEVMASGGRFVRMNTTSCGKKYVPNLGEQVKVFSALKDYKGSRINNTAIDYDVFHSFDDNQEMFTEDLAYLYNLLQIGRIEPKIFSSVGFDGFQEEWQKIMRGGADGVVIVQPCKD